LDILLTRHASERRQGRGISIEEIKQVIIKGRKRIHADVVISCYHHICVVWRKSGETFVIITVGYEDEEIKW
jgi:hypothetical protein